MSTPASTRAVALTLVELHCALRHLRNVKEDLKSAILLLQEQVRSGNNGYRNAAQLVLDGELSVVEEICRKLWEAITAPAISTVP